MNKICLSFNIKLLIISTLLSYRALATLSVDPLSEETSVMIDPIAAECQQFRAQLPSDFIQGFVDVPEDLSQPTGRQISVFYYGKLSPNRAPILYLNGGPTLSSHGYFTSFQALSFANTLPIIYFDQRGTGCSTRYPDQKVNAESLTRLQNYGSKEIISDAEAIRMKLLGKNGKWQVLGHSFGGYYAHAYVKYAPQNLISVHSVAFALEDDSIQVRVNRSLAQNRVFQEYAKIYPDDVQLISKIRSSIDALGPEANCFVNGTTSICGNNILDVLALNLGSRSTWPRLHQILTDFFPNQQFSTEYLKSFVKNRIFGSFWGHNFAFSALIKLELYSPYTAKQVCKLAKDQLLAQGERPDLWSLLDCRLQVTDPFVSELIESTNYGGRLSLADFAQELKQTKIPFYLYASKLDSTVPMASFTDEVKMLGDRINYTLFPNSGHDNIYTESTIWSDLQKPLNKQ